MARILGIDYGECRVGLAIGDELGMMALPLTVLQVRGTKQIVLDVLDICREKQVTTIVVGLPLNMDGSRGSAAAAVDKFIQRLREQSALPVEVWDERLSSRQAERLLIDSDVSRRKRKGLVDQLAAHVVLQSYLDAHAQKTPYSDNSAGEDN